VSIASNVAEGDERETDKEAVRFFFIAKGSLAELRTQIQIAHEAGNLQKDVYDDIESDCETSDKMLGGLIRTRSRFRRP
jgi:four helix bundle protein